MSNVFYGLTYIIFLKHVKWHLTH